MTRSLCVRTGALLPLEHGTRVSRSLIWRTLKGPRRWGTTGVHLVCRNIKTNWWGSKAIFGSVSLGLNMKHDWNQQAASNAIVAVHVRTCTRDVDTHGSQNNNCHLPHRSSTSKGEGELAHPRHFLTNSRQNKRTPSWDPQVNRPNKQWLLI